MPQNIPTWKQVTSSTKFQQATPEQQDAVRNKWLNDVTKANPKFSPDQVRELVRRTAPGAPPEADIVQPVAQTPQVEENPEPFDTTIDQMANMPPGTTITPSGQAQQPSPVAPQVNPYAQLAKEQFKATPIGQVAEGYKRGGIGGALGAGFSAPARLLKKGFDELSWKGALQLMGPFIAGQNAVVGGMMERRQQLQDTDWFSQDPKDRIKDIKETIDNKGFRTNFGDFLPAGDQNPIPIDFSLPDRLTDIIRNQSAAGRTPEQIDQILMRAYNEGGLKDIPKVVGRKGEVKDEQTGEAISVLDNPMAALGVGFADLLSGKGMVKGARRALIGEPLTVGDMRKQLKGKTYEERLGVINGLAVTLIGDMLTDPIILTGIPQSIADRVSMKIARGEMKNAANELKKLEEGLKYAKEAERIKAYRRFKEKGLSKKFNLLNDALEKTTKSKQGLVVTPSRSLPGGRITEQKALTEATPQALRGARGQPITEPGPTGLSPLSAGEATLPEKVGEAIPVGRASEEAVRKAGIETTAERLAKPALPSGEKKALPPAKGAKGELKEGKPAIPLRGAKTELPDKLPQEVVPTEETIEDIVKSIDNAEYRGLQDMGKENYVGIHNTKNGSTTQIPLSKATPSYIKQQLETSISDGIKNWNRTFKDEGIKGVKAIDLVDNGNVVVENTATGATKTFTYEDIVDQAKRKNILDQWLQPKITAPTKKISTPTVTKVKAKAQKIFQPTKKIKVAEPTQDFTVSGSEIVPKAELRKQEVNTIEQYIKKYGVRQGEYQGEKFTTGLSDLRQESAKAVSGGSDAIKRATERDLKRLNIYGETDSINKSPDYLPIDPEEPFKPGDRGGGVVLGSLFGGLQQFFENRAARRLTTEGLEHWKKPTFSVVKPWIEKGFERTGEAIKNIYSVAESVAERGIKNMQQLSKIAGTGKWTVLGKTKYSQDDLAEIVLLANNKARWDALPNAEKLRLKDGVVHINKFFKDAQSMYRKYGANLDFKGNMMKVYEDQIMALGKITQDLRTTPTQFWSKDIFKDLGFDMKEYPRDIPRKDVIDFIRQRTRYNGMILDKLNKMEFVHIPYDLWFNTAQRTNPAATLKALRIANANKRKTILIEDLLEAGAINKEDINAFDILASYTHKMSKDIPMLNVKKIAMEQGLISKEAKTGFQRMPAYQAPMFSDVHMHPAFREWLTDFKYQTFNVNMIDKAFSTVKMWQFAKPLFLPYYDMWQAAVARAFSNPLTLPRDIRNAARMMWKKDAEYFEWMEKGLASRPIDVPWNQFEDQLKSLKGTSFGEHMINLLKNGNYTVLKPVYNALWEIAWQGDRFVRLMTGSYFKNSLKMPIEDAAKLAALFHSDYANVPIQTRRWMNKIMFTPTFKVTMMRLYKEMAKAALKVPIKMLKGEKLAQSEKQLAKAGLATVGGAMFAFDQLMTRGFGYERDQFARRYYKRVENPDMPGTLQDHVVVFSNPLTQIPKYYYKGQKIFEGFTTDNKLETMVKTMAWEFHPLYRIGTSLAMNRKPDGDFIVTPFEDHEEIAYMKKAGWALKEALKVIEEVPAFKEKEQTEAWEKWKKDVGPVMSYLNAPATFSYFRKPELVQQGFKLKKIQDDITKALLLKESRGKRTPELEQKMLKNSAEIFDRELKKLDQMLAEYDKQVQELGGARRKPKKKKPIEKPTPFISVPNYTPPPPT